MASKSDGSRRGSPPPGQDDGEGQAPARPRSRRGPRRVADVQLDVRFIDQRFEAGRELARGRAGDLRADPRRLITHQRRAVSIAFLAFGVVIGSWVPRLPALKDHLRLSDGQIGYALLLFSVGAVLGAFGARPALGRGARSWVRVGTVAICTALVGPALAGTFTQLLIAFLVLGACAGFIDMLENAQAAELERLAGRPLINGFHGFWSLGAIIGSVFAGGAAYVGVSPLTQFAVAAIVAAALSAPFLSPLPDTRSGAPRLVPSRAGRLWLSGSVIAVAAVAFCGLLVEGGTADWSSLYLR